MLEILRGADNKNNRIMLLAMIVISISMLLISNIAVVKSKQETDSLSRKMIRFHVVANSDTTEDQLLKQQVKDEIIEYVEPIVKQCENLEETRDTLISILPDIQIIAGDVVAEYGKGYDVYVAMDNANFPTKAYGDVVLPAGEYETCRVIIGEGKGENWWCVMYPPLCYIDAASGVVPLEGKEQLRQGLSEEQYKLITKENQETRYKVKFKIVDTINSIICRDNYKSKR